MRDRAPRAAERGGPWRKVALTAIIATLALAGIAIYVGVFVGDLGLSPNGYIALAAGAVGTAAVTVALFSLVFFSDRAGYDDKAGETPGRKTPDRGDGVRRS